jgi:hypothetical protein
VFHVTATRGPLSPYLVWQPDLPSVVNSSLIAFSFGLRICLGPCSLLPESPGLCSGAFLPHIPYYSFTTRFSGFVSSLSRFLAVPVFGFPISSALWAGRM